MNLRQTFLWALAVLTAAAALAQPRVSTTSLPNGVVGQSYNQTLTANGGGQPFVWSLQSGALPGGLGLDSAGDVSGVPSVPGTSNFAVQATDKQGRASSPQALSILINPPPLSITTSSLAAATVGAAYSQSLMASGGTGAYNWSLAGGALSPGLGLAADGTLAGTPTASGVFNFIAQVSDSAKSAASRTFGLAVNPPPLSITTNSLPNGTLGAAYSASLTASGGSGTYSWSITKGSLPAGLSLSGSTISGTPTAGGNSNFTVQVSDGVTAPVSKGLGINVMVPPLTITTTSLPNGTVGSPYSASLTASGGTGLYSWAIARGSLPAGLSLTGSTIAGTPTAAGNSSFAVQVTDGTGPPVSAQLAISVTAPPVTITTASLPSGVVGTAYSGSLSASGGSGTYSWSITAGSLPAGLSLSGSAISGTPTAAGTSTFTVQVNDGVNPPVSKPLAIAISAPPLTITTLSLPIGTVGTAYSGSLSASGGSGTYTWSISAGSLPAGLSLSGSAISGTPTAAGTSNFTVQVSDGVSPPVSKALAITVNAAAVTITITTPSLLAAGSIGFAYSQSLSATGASGAYSWSLLSGSLPPGLNLSGATISGTPTTTGTFGFTIQASAGGATASKQFAITIAGPTLAVSTGSLPDATAGAAYSQTLAATGGAGGYSWSIVGGQLPPGLALAPSGAIAGTPIAGGVFGFTVQVTDTAAAQATAKLSITVHVALTISTQSVLASGAAGAGYSQNLVANGGTGGLTWTLLSGTLPAGLTLHPNGLIDGVPTQVGSFSITAQVADTTGLTASAAFSLSISSGLTIATPPVLPGATIGAAYSAALQAAGGTQPYVWSVTAGALPAGLTFGADGKISGTPTASGSFTFTVQIVDANSNKSTKQFTLAVAPALTITTAPTLPNGASNAPYQAKLAVTGGNPPYLWSVTAGALPAGLTLDEAGTLSGTPTSSGAFTFTATATDSASVSASRQFSLAIGQGLTISSAASLPGATAGAAYHFQLTASGGAAPYSWSITAGALPAGLSLNATTGTISGAPSATGVFNFTVQVNDSANLSAAGVDSLSVALPALSALSINGPPAAAAPLQQPTVDLALANPYPVAVAGVLALTFTPSGSNGADDPSIQFSTGGRTATFNIPANATHAVFAAPQLAFQTGAVAGTISIAVQSLQAGSASLPVPPGLSVTTQINAAPPVIRTVSMVAATGGFQVQIVGLSNTREVKQATVSFVPSTGGSLQTGQLTIPLSDSAQTWFQSADSKPFGGQFTLTLPFTVQGGSNAVGSVSVILTNSAGDSPAAPGSYN